MTAEKIAALPSPGEIDSSRFIRGPLQPETREDVSYAMLGLLTRRFRRTHDDEVSRPGELHPQALAEPYVNVSAHTAPSIRPPGRRPSWYQWANNLGSRPATPMSQCAARRGCRRRRLYFRMAQRTRRSLR